MNSEANSDESKPSGMSGSVRVVAGVCVLTLALTGVLVVLEVIPRSSFTELSGKVLAIGGIGLVTSLVLGLLARR